MVKRRRRVTRRKRPGRPPVLEDGVMLSARIERKDFDALVRLAEDEGLERSKYLRRLLSRHIEAKRRRRSG